MLDICLHQRHHARSGRATPNSNSSPLGRLDEAWIPGFPMWRSGSIASLQNTHQIELGQHAADQREGQYGRR